MTLWNLVHVCGKDMLDTKLKHELSSMNDSKQTYFIKIRQCGKLPVVREIQVLPRPETVESIR